MSVFVINTQAANYIPGAGRIPYLNGQSVMVIEAML